MPVPAGLQARFANFIVFMLTRGVTVPVAVFSKVTTYDQNNAPNGRQLQQIASFDAYEDLGGGSSEPHQEGQPIEDTTAIYFAPDASLTPANFSERWVVIAGESSRQYRITACQSFGPYVMASLVAGAVGDAAGNTR